MSTSTDSTNSVTITTAIGALRDLQHPTAFAPLTISERHVLALLVDGLAPKQAAWELRVAISTVRSHIAAAKRKTGARTLQQLVGAYAVAGMPAQQPSMTRRSSTSEPHEVVA